MSFNSNILISSTFSNYSYSYLSSSELATYYIHDLSNQDFEIASGQAQTLAHDNSNEIFIRSIFNDLDPLISLDFNEVFDPNEAIFRIYSVSDFNNWDGSTVGEVSIQSNYWDILWRNSNSDNNFDQNTIIHEIGHALGLSHPNEEPTNPLWNTDITVMSYNKSATGWNTSFTNNDIQALQSIWGTEEEGLLNNIETSNENLLEVDDLPLVDDYSQDQNTSGSINHGQTIDGSLEFLGDRDWFAMNLSAGQILQLQVTGNSSNSRICSCFFCHQNSKKLALNGVKNTDNSLMQYKSLDDPYLRFYDSESNLLFFDDDSGIDNASLIQYTVQNSGIYYASVGAYNDNYKGDYTLSLTLDDYSNDFLTTGELIYSEEVFGDLEVFGDRDWFSLKTLEGDEIEISLIGNSLKDPYLNIYNSDGLIVKSNDDYSSETLDAKIKFFASYSGEYFISVESFKNSYKGSYSLGAELLNSTSNENSHTSYLETDSEILNYIASNPDLIRTFGTDLIEAKNHYINYGISEGRETNNFNVTNYLNNYSDLSNAFGTDSEAAIRHYINNGYFEGRTYLPLSSINSVNDELIIDSNSETSISSSSGFSDLETLNYIASNPDLIIAFGTDLIEANNHYINYGISEGRETNNFNVTNYLNNYSDLSNAFGTDSEAAIRHYINNGYFEGRTFF